MSVTVVAHCDWSIEAKKRWMYVAVRQGVLGIIDVVDGRRGEGVPEADDVKTWEGWILGQQA